MHRAVLSRMNSVSNSKTYLYRFDLISKQNHFKRLFTGKFKKFKGASHFDDIAYLFKGSLFPDPEIFSHEMEMIEMMVSFLKLFSKALFHCNNILGGTIYIIRNIKYPKI